MLLASPPHYPETLAALGRDLKDTKDQSQFWQKVREQFLLPKDLAYLNTGGLGSSPRAVVDQVQKKMTAEERYPVAGHNQNDWHRIRRKCATLLGEGIDGNEVALIGCATEGINIIINGLPLKPGDEVITSTHEHVALEVPLLHARQTRGIMIKTFQPDIQNGAKNLQLIKQLVNARTRLIFISHITCTNGQIFPVAEIGKMARERGIWFALDGAQAAGQIPLSLTRSGVDFYCTSCHKWLLAPKRTGLLYCRKSQVKNLQPSIVGAYSGSSHSLGNRSLTLYADSRKFEYGTQNDALFYGLETAVDFINTVGLAGVYKHNQALAEEFYHRLQTMDNIEILSPSEKRYRSTMISFRIDGMNNYKCCQFLLKKRLRVRPVPEAGLNAIRVSFHLYNNREELEKLVREIARFQIHG